MSCTVAKLALTNASSASRFVKLSCGPLVEDIVVPAMGTKVRHFNGNKLADEPEQRGSSVPCDMVSDGAISALRPVGIITPPYSIVRTVSGSGSNWTYAVSKDGRNASVQLP